MEFERRLVGKDCVGSYQRVQVMNDSSSAACKKKMEVRLRVERVTRSLKLYERASPPYIKASNNAYISFYLTNPTQRHAVN